MKRMIPLVLGLMMIPTPVFASTSVQSEQQAIEICKKKIRKYTAKAKAADTTEEKNKAKQKIAFWNNQKISHEGMLDYLKGSQDFSLEMKGIDAKMPDLDAQDAATKRKMDKIFAKDKVSFDASTPDIADIQKMQDETLKQKQTKANENLQKEKVSLLDTLKSFFKF